MTPGQTYRFLDFGGYGAETVAEVVGSEELETGLGTFSCFRVDVALASAPETTVVSLWFCSGVGIVRQTEYDSGAQTWNVELDEYVVNGSGYFPMQVTNWWTYGESVPVGARSISRLKAGFLD
jgi:hypothetical protein